MCSWDEYCEGMTTAGFVDVTLVERVEDRVREWGEGEDEDLDRTLEI